MLPPDTILQNRYRIVRLLGHGGMGSVYEAIDQRLKCVVALKETTVGRENAARKAFEREAALLANLRHHALPKVMDYFSENEGDFLVMEFVPGHDLAELLDLRKSPFPQSQVLPWADDLLELLEYLHGQKPPILHRDIKPANLKLTKSGEVFLLDFGLAKGSAGRMPGFATNRSVPGYTPVYASLEQILGQGTDVRSDVYSLGATLYHLLTGVAPIDAPRRFHKIEDAESDPLQPIRKLNSQVSQNVAAIIHQAMAINRRQRPASAAELRKALRNVVEDDEWSSEEATKRDENMVGRKRAEIQQDGPRLALQTDEQSEHSRIASSRTPNRTAFIAAAAVVMIGAVLVVWLLTRDEGILNNAPSEQVAQPSVVNTPNMVNPSVGTVMRNQIGMELVWIPSGSFNMGSTNGDADEKPVHQVNINEPFYMGKFEVTQAQWKAVMGDNPSNFKDCGSNCPVENISWDDANEFIWRLNGMNDGYVYRLPTEAEWEYACRAGSTGDYAGDVKEMAWFSENSGNKTHAIGQKQLNAWGLADMNGNVWEWCEDWYHETYYGAPANGSGWLSGGEQKARVLRGGSWFSDAVSVRSANRHAFAPITRVYYFGLRVVAVR